MIYLGRFDSKSLLCHIKDVGSILSLACSSGLCVPVGEVCPLCTLQNRSYWLLKEMSMVKLGVQRYSKKILFKVYSQALVCVEDFRIKNTCQAELLNYAFYRAALTQILGCMDSGCLPADISSGYGYCIDAAPAHVLASVNIQGS